MIDLDTCYGKCIEYVGLFNKYNNNKVYYNIYYILYYNVLFIY